MQVVDNIKFEKFYDSADYTAQAQRHTEIALERTEIDKIQEQLQHDDVDLQFSLDVMNQITESAVDETKNTAENEQLQKHLKSLADNDGDLGAANSLAVMYFVGNNINNAVKYFQMASDLGHPAAGRNLAIVLETTKGADIDLEKVFKLYESSASKNDVIALNNLGCCYMLGEGTELNYKKAVQCFEEAVKRKDKLAMVNLGDCFLLGNGVTKNLKKAYQLFSEGAEMGVPTAIRKVAECYLDGLGTEKNTSEALRYFKMAADAGDEKSARQYEALNDKLTPQKHNTIDDIFAEAKKTADKANEKNAKDTAEKTKAEPNKFRKEQRHEL